MVTTPWELHDRFSQMLQAQTARDQAIGAGLQQDQFAAELGRQNATTQFGRDLQKDQINFGQAQSLAADQRRFMHEENKLINLDYKLATKGRGRAGYVNQPTAPGAVNTPGGGTGGNRMSPQYAYQHLTSRGMPPIVAAGLVGNIAAETGWDPAVFNGTRRGDGGTAFGSGQWRHERQEHLFKFAQSRGNPFPTPEDQLDFYAAEAEAGTDPGATKAFQLASQAQSPEEAAQIIMDFYERPADQSSSEHRRSAARQVFEEFGGQSSAPSSDPSVGAGGSGGAPIDTEQRRSYVGDPIAQPDVNVTTGATDQTIAPGMSVEDWAAQPSRPWTTEDFIANGITPLDMQRVPPNMDVVGTEFYSGASLDLMDPIMQRRLVPLGGYSPEETNQYLVLQPKAGSNPIDDYGNPIEQQPNAIGVPPPEQPTVAATAVPQSAGEVQNAPLPNAINASPVPVPQTSVPQVQGAPMPNAPVSNAPTGQRTRRAPDGSLEFLVDGQWRPSGG